MVFLLDILMAKRINTLIFELDTLISTTLSNQILQDLQKTFMSSEFSSSFVMTKFYHIVK